MTRQEMTTKMQAIKTIRQLHDFRNELLDLQTANSQVGKDKINFDEIYICQNAAYYEGLCKLRIENLASQGIFLDSIIIDDKTKTP